MITTLAFDCFGTIFDMSEFPRQNVADYVAHVKRNDFTEYTFDGPWWDLEAFPDVRLGLAKLKAKGVKCFAFSNGQKRLLETLCEKNGLTFDGIWNPVEHQLYKPNVKAYATFCRWVDVSPECCAMITANPTFGDVEGAKANDMLPVVVRHGWPNDLIELADWLERAAGGGDE